MTQQSSFNHKAALFDLDGVVFNTEPQYTEFWRGECQKYHPEKPGLENEIKGRTLVEIYDTFFADVKSEQPAITKRLNEFESRMEFPYIEGFVEFDKLLRDNGLKTAVVTSSNRAKMDNVYRRYPYFKQMFDAILTAEDFERSKPDPDCYLKGAARFGFRPDDCIGFEDSINGLKAVRAAGMLTVGLATTLPRNEVASLADVVIDNYTEEWIHRILRFI